MNVLALDVGGIPRQWLSFEQAILYQAKNQVAWSLGDTVATFRGGIQNDGTESILETPSIIVLNNPSFSLAWMNVKCVQLGLILRR